MRESRIALLLLGIVAVFLIGVTLRELRTVLVPFSVALLLSFMFQPLVIYLKGKRFPTYLSLAAVLLSLMLVLGLVGLGIFQSARTLRGEVSRYQSRIDQVVEDINVRIAPYAEPLGVDLEEFNAEQVIETTFSWFLSTARLDSFVTFLANTFMVVLFMMFILAGSGELATKVRKAYPPNVAERVREVTANITRGVRRYLLAKTFVSGLTGLLVGLVLWILGVDFPVFWGFLTFVFNFIPNVGSVAAVVLAFLFAALQGDTLVNPLWVLLALAVIQMVIGNVIDPWLMASNLDLSPVVVIMSLIFWAWLWGIAGAVLAVPLTATLKIMLENVSLLRPLAVLMGSAPKGAAIEPLS